MAQHNLPSLHRLTLVIASGTALTPSFETAGFYPVSIQMPAAWDAAALTFDVTNDSHGGAGATFLPAYDGAGAEKAVAAGNVAADRNIDIGGLNLDRYTYIKIRSGTKALAVNQTANRTLVVLMRRVS